jgi:Na+-translocating ferredoxin:NAD+ oxidoreductase RnfD subunit
MSPRSASAQTVAGTRSPPAAAHEMLLHSGTDITHALFPRVLGTVFPLAAGLSLFGWRAAVTAGLVVAGAWIGLRAWQRIGRRGAALEAAPVLWTAVLMSLALPAHLGAARPLAGIAGPWAAALAAGLAIPMLLWLGHGLPPWRVHPVALVAAALWLLLPGLMEPQRVLQRGHVVVGDLLDVSSPALPPAPREPWARALPESRADAVLRNSPARQLSSYTRRRLANQGRRAWSLDELLRDRLPPLEDLIIGGQPAAIGMGSAVALILGGLYMLYRSAIDYRVPLVALVTTYAALLVLPVPLAVTASAAQWGWLAAARPDVGLSIGLTLVHYELLAGPALFVAFYLATVPGVCPLTRRPRALFAFILGLLTAVLQLYLSVEYGAYIALVACGLIAPILERR